MEVRVLGEHHGLLIFLSVPSVGLLPPCSCHSADGLVGETASCFQGQAPGQEDTQWEEKLRQPSACTPELGPAGRAL